MTLQDNKELSIVISKRISEFTDWKTIFLNDTAGEETKMVRSLHKYILLILKVKMFLALGFRKVDEEWYEYKLIWVDVDHLYI